MPVIHVSCSIGGYGLEVSIRCDLIEGRCIRLGQLMW